MEKKEAGPIEKGNAQKINEICSSMIPLPLLRYSAIADFYTEEPKQIGIRINDSDSGCTFEQVFRFRVWIPNQITYSWLIYAKNREWLSDDNELDGLLVRYVAWRRDLDLEKVKKTHKENKELFLNNWPRIETENIFIKPQMCSELIKILRKGDKILSKGITFIERKSTARKPNWRDMEVNRMFDWGTVHAVWCPFMENKEVERYIINLDKYLKKHANIEMDNIYQMNLDFTYPPEMYKQLINGTEK